MLGGFNGKGQYTINALRPLGGLNRIVGEGSFEATIEIENIFFYPTLQQNPPGFTLWLRDDRVRTLSLHVKKHEIALKLDDEQGKCPQPAGSNHRIRYDKPPRSLKLKLAYNERTKQVRIFYGFDGAQTVIELPQSMAGIYFGEPLTESAAIYLLFSSGRMDIDHFEIVPLGP